MEELKRIYGLCPECKKGYLVKETLYKGIILNRKKILIFYCPLCNFENKKVFKLNEQQYQEEIQ